MFSQGVFYFSTSPRLVSWSQVCRHAALIFCCQGVLAVGQVNHGRAGAGGKEKRGGSVSHRNIALKTWGLFRRSTPTHSLTHVSTGVYRQQQHLLLLLSLSLSLSLSLCFFLPFFLSFFLSFFPPTPRRSVLSAFNQRASASTWLQC